MPPVSGGRAAARYIPASYTNPGSRVYKRRAKRAAFRERLRNGYDSMSLKTAFSMYVIFFMLLALILTALTMGFFSRLQSGIISQYQMMVGYDYDLGQVYFSELRFFHIETGELSIQYMSGVDSTVYYLLRSLYFLAIPVIFISCISLSGILFFRNRLEQPMKLLDESSRRISGKDLGFTIASRRHDEMGRLIDSFEKMRVTLFETNSEMWRQMNERRRLNSAFSHDLRTPLTVLKGNAYMLKEYLGQGAVPVDKMESTVATMTNHIERLENYVNVMSRLQKLEDIEIHKNDIGTKELTETLRNTASILAEGLKLTFYNDIRMQTLHVDDEIVMQVAENMISNAVRYAKKRIAIVCNYISGRLTISVSDDGNGFSPDDLNLATNPFYKAKKNVHDTHFGLGLNISKILTERHGGCLTLGNVEAGGALVKAEFAE